MGSRVPNRVPPGVQVVSVLGDEVVALHARRVDIENERRSVVEVAVQAYCDPIPLLVISPCDPFFDAVRLGIKCADSDVEIACVVDDFERGILTRRFSLVGVPLHETLFPVRLLPAGLVELPIDDRCVRIGFFRDVDLLVDGTGCLAQVGGEHDQGRKTQYFDFLHHGPNGERSACPSILFRRELTIKVVAFLFL